MRRLFAILFTALLHIIMFGWSYLPDSLTYAVTHQPAVYQKPMEIWAWTGTLIMVLFVTICSYLVGTLIYETHFDKHKY